MKKFTKFCLIMALAFVLVGIACGIGAFSAGISWASFREAGDGLRLWQNHGSSLEIDSEESEQIREIEKTENIQEIKLDTKSADVNVYPLEDWKQKNTVKDGSIIVEVYQRDQDVDIVAEDEKLSVEVISESGSRIGWKRTAVINIYLPENCTLQSLEMVCTSGNVDIETDLETAYLNLVVGSGGIDLEHVVCSQNMRMSCGSGGITFDGSIAGNLDANTGSGKIEMTLIGKETDYNYQVVCGSGDVSVNGNEYEHIYEQHNQHENHHQNGTMNLKCGSGTIELEIHE